MNEIFCFFASSFLSSKSSLLASFNADWFSSEAFSGIVIAIIGVISVIITNRLTRKTDLEKIEAEHKNSIETLLAKTHSEITSELIANYQAQNKELHDKIDLQNKEIGELKNKVTSLMEENEKIRKYNEELLRQNNELIQQNRKLTEQNEKLLSNRINND